MRLDSALVEKGYYSSRAKAQDAIKEGLVSVNEKTVNKSSFNISEDDIISVKEDNRFVSRAGDKLLQAVEQFHIDLKGKTVCDIGSSTGGFSDCCLQNGASKVYCIDVGTNQLDDKLRQDSRIVVRENTNARYLKKEDFEDAIDFICMDVSFISVKLLLQPISEILKEGGEAVILIKPQFEVGRQYLNKHGIVTDTKRREAVRDEIISLLPLYNLVKYNCVLCDVAGRSGNREYLLHVKKKGIC